MALSFFNLHHYTAAAMYWYPAKVKVVFDLDNDLEPVALLIVGYKSETAKPRPGHLMRKSKNEILLK